MPTKCISKALGNHNVLFEPQISFSDFCLACCQTCLMVLQITHPLRVTSPLLTLLLSMFKCSDSLIHSPSQCAAQLPNATRVLAGSANGKAQGQVENALDQMPAAPLLASQSPAGKGHADDWVQGYLAVHPDCSKDDALKGLPCTLWQLVNMITSILSCFTHGMSVSCCMYGHMPIVAIKFEVLH